jgi:hypothetical protein
MTGTTWLEESGLLDGPVLTTNTPVWAWYATR